MQILPRSILPLLRRLNVANSPAPMHRLSPGSRLLRSFMASASPRSWPPALGQRDSALMAPPNPPVILLSRFPYGSQNMANTSGVKGEELGKADRHPLIPSSSGEADEEKDARKATEDDNFLCGNGPPGEGEEHTMRETKVSDDEEFECLEGKRIPCSDYDYHSNDVRAMYIYPNSRHRDGSIYRNTDAWTKEYRIADRNETRFEAMMLSNPKDCIFPCGTCKENSPSCMLQVFSLKLAKITMNGGLVELYGYIATRDILDPLLNYVVKFSREEPISVEQGSLIEMTGPKRGIEFYYSTLIEYDLRIKTGEHENDDLQLIDGVSSVDEWGTPTRNTFTKRIHGDCGAVDITVSCLDWAVEATIEVVISEVQSSFNLCLGCFTSGFCDEIRLFDGTISESRGLKRYVVAVAMNTCMDLKFKLVSGPSYSSGTEHCCSFKAFIHGRTSQQIKVEFASITVNVTWSTLSFSVVN